MAWNCIGTKLASGSVDQTARIWHIEPHGHVRLLLIDPFFLCVWLNFVLIYFLINSYQENETANYVVLFHGLEETKGFYISLRSRPVFWVVVPEYGFRANGIKGHISHIKISSFEWRKHKLMFTKKCGRFAVCEKN